MRERERERERHGRWRRYVFKNFQKTVKSLKKSLLKRKNIRQVHKKGIEYYILFNKKMINAISQVFHNARHIR